MHTRTHANGKKSDHDHDHLDAADSASALVAASGELADKIEPVADDLEDELEAARHKLRQLEIQIKAKAASADEIVHTHAWKFIGAAAGLGIGAGFIAGALTFRR